MKTKMLIPILCLILSALISCDANEPPIDRNTLKLTLIDVAVTEAYLKINTERLDKEIHIVRDNRIILSYKPSAKDTIITDAALSENSSHKYFAVISDNGKTTAQSNDVNVTTLNRSSHNFTWQKFLFGEASYSEFKDVSIIDENNIWVVGRVMLRDSLGSPDTDIYNAVHWNGGKWNLTRINVNYHNTNVIPSLESIFAINSNNIWVTSGITINGQGDTWILYHLYDMGILSSNDGSLSKSWSNKDGKLYFAGLKGTLVYHESRQNIWKKLQNGIAEDINDIWGIEKPDGSYEVYCPVTNLSNFNENIIIKIDNNNKVTSIKSCTEHLTNSIWTNKGFPIYISGDGIFENKTGQWKEVDYGVNKALMKIRGNSANDIAAAGLDGTIVHYNGIDWKSYPELGNQAIFNSIAIKGNIIVAVGMENYKAVIAVGRR